LQIGGGVQFVLFTLLCTTTSARFDPGDVTVRRNWKSGVAKPTERLALDPVPSEFQVDAPCDRYCQRYVYVPLPPEGLVVQVSVPAVLKELGPLMKADIDG
jgi:hypothetical protein